MVGFELSFEVLNIAERDIFKVSSRSAKVLLVHRLTCRGQGTHGLTVKPVVSGENDIPTASSTCKLDRGFDCFGTRISQRNHTKIMWGNAGQPVGQTLCSDGAQRLYHNRLHSLLLKVQCLPDLGGIMTKRQRAILR